MYMYITLHYKVAPNIHVAFNNVVKLIVLQALCCIELHVCFGSIRLQSEHGFSIDNACLKTTCEIVINQ